MVLGDAGSPQRQLAKGPQPGGSPVMNSPYDGANGFTFPGSVSPLTKQRFGRMVRNVSLSLVGKDREKLSFTWHLRPFKVLDMSCLLLGECLLSGSPRYCCRIISVHTTLHTCLCHSGLLSLEHFLQLLPCSRPTFSRRLP